jgi:outer membrane protein assembly factor BamA
VRFAALLVLLAALSATRTAAAQPAPATQPTPAPAAIPAVGPPPPQWIDWDLSGTLIPDEDPETIKHILNETMETHRALTQSAQDDISAAVEHIGYRLVRLDAKPAPGGGVHAILVLDTIPMVRSVAVSVQEEHWYSPFVEPLFDDEIKRRMRLRPGAYLLYEAPKRKLELDEEQARIAEYLHDEGYFDARATIKLTRVDTPGVRVRVEVSLGPTYEIGQVKVTGLSPQSPVSEAEVREVFEHRGRLCVPWLGCLIPSRFNRTQHLQDQAEVTRTFQSRGFPAVKISTDFDPATSFDRRRHTVSFTVHVDERRQVDVVFEGNSPDAFPEGALRSQLTFDDAASADDYEIAASAQAIQAYYQSHGHFDAVVTWGKERFRLVDHVVFRIDEGPVRELKRVEFVAVDGDLAVDKDDLRKVVSLEASSFLSGSSFASPTAQTLADDAERVRRRFVQAGYADAQVAVRVGPDPDHLGSPAVIGALLAAGIASNDLYVRFDIQQGDRVLLDAVEVAFVGAHRGTCATAMAQLADSLDVDDLAERAGGGCRAELEHTAVPALPDQIEGARAKLKDWFWSLGRPRAEAQVTIHDAGDNPHHKIATYTVIEHGDVRIGKVIVRGNFRTRTRWILRELGFREGAPLTGDLYASGPRRLRAMNLFSAVNVELLGFEEGEQDRVDVVVRVEERNDVFAQVDLEAGYTQVNGDYARASITLPNPVHNGMSFQAALTLPLHWVPPVIYLIDADAKFESIDLDWKTPRWVMRSIALPADNDTQLFIRQQDTPRFGQLRTLGASDALSRVFQRPRTEDHPARSIALTLRYDFRRRNRDEDAIRADGPHGDVPQVPIQTETASVGLSMVYDRRLDARGNLNPLIPEAGFKLEAGGLFATPYLDPLRNAQDTFFKINASGQYIYTINDRLQLHFDGKFDEGIPLDGALLPEVERFFAGGDTTVRGYAEDRLATEIVEVGVPPFGNLDQIRVLPAGGNIRVLWSADAQVRVWKLLGIPVATAVFCDVGLITNTWRAVTTADIKPSVGVSLFRWLAPFGAISIDYAVPLRPRLGDNQTGFFAISVALR